MRLIAGAAATLFGLISIALFATSSGGADMNVGGPGIGARPHVVSAVADPTIVFWAAVGHLNEEEVASSSAQHANSAVPTSEPTATNIHYGPTPAAPVASGRTPSLNGTYCTTSGATRTCLTYHAGRLTRKCVTAAGRSTCTYYNTAGKPYSRCVTKKGRKRCVRLPSSAGGAATTKLNWQGWPSHSMATVGLLGIQYPDGAYGTCTGTVVSHAVVLTAAHCLWDPDHGGYAAHVSFAPGVTWRDFSNQDPKDILTPEGIWGGARWWVAKGYAEHGAFGLDYGLIEVPPVSGKYLSDSTSGAWTVTWNIRFNPGAHIYVAGYPANGYWATKNGGLGRGLYACDANTDGDYQNEDTGYALWSPCSMNQGSSGGPWFVQLRDGSWTIGAVTSRCYGPNKCSPWAQAMLGTYFNGHFGNFWNSVWPQLRWH